MSLTLLKDRAGIRCNQCGIERSWQRSVYPEINSLRDIQTWAVERGYTFDGTDLCAECSRRAQGVLITPPRPEKVSR